MKHILLSCALALLTPFISCSHDDNDTAQLPNAGTGTSGDEAESRRFAFAVKGDFDNPTFLKSSLSADGSGMTDLWVVDYKDGEIKQELHQSNTDPDFGSPKMSLTLGPHHILFLASRGQNPTYNNGIVSWQKPLDTFYKDYEVTVIKTTDGNRSVTLDRCATKATIYVEDPIPTGTSTISLTPTKWYTAFNLLTGQPIIAPSDYSVSFALPSAYAGVSGTNYSIWSLCGIDEWQTNITIESKTNETINATAVITNAPLKANRATIYHGNLYTTNSHNTLSLNTDWLAAYEALY